MEQKEKTSPVSGSSMFDPAKASSVPGSNLFDPTTLLGKVVKHKTVGIQNT
jgi:hypothetical protein